MSEYECSNCGWQGDESAVQHASNRDGGYCACPVGCTASYQGRVEPLAVMINPAGAQVIRRYGLMISGGWSV